MIKKILAAMILSATPALAMDNIIKCAAPDDEHKTLFVQFNYDYMLVSTRHVDLTPAQADLVFKNGKNEEYKLFKETIAPYSEDALIRGTYTIKDEELTGTLTVMDIDTYGAIVEGYGIRINRKTGDAVFDSGELNNTAGYVIPFEVETNMKCLPYKPTLF